MIGFLTGVVVFSDGQETIVQTPSGIGYQVYLPKVLIEGAVAQLFISHIIRENDEALYGFESLRAKKLFELLLQVKGVGPKSAFALMSSLGVMDIIQSIQTEDRKKLKSAPGVGDKAAAQMILDLSKKVFKVQMYSDARSKINVASMMEQESLSFEQTASSSASIVSASHDLLDEALMACRELGFKDEKIIPLAQKILGESEIHRSEQLVHLVLKQI
jgi:Holliday junction DNA helicase RuvA